MIEYDRFWTGGDGTNEDEDSDAEAPPGVTASEILAWERRHGVTLPEPIRTALGIRNGGAVRKTSIGVSPLDEIVPVDADFWEWTEIDDAEAPDRGLVFAFGDDTESGATIVMNFNARGPQGAPSVYIDHHGDGSSRLDGSIAGFFEAQLASDADPSIDWREAEAAPEILARETIDLTEPGEVEPASLEQILAREGETLILSTRERTPEGETLERTALPLPLDADRAEIRPHRPGPGGTFALHLQPREYEGIVHVESKADADGGWKNSTARGVPIYVPFESPSRDRLLALRRRLLGRDGEERAPGGGDRQAALEEILGTLTPEQRTAAMLKAAMGLQAETFRGALAQSADPEIAAAVAAMQRRVAEMAARVHRNAESDPPDPETIRRIAELLDPDAR